MTTDIEKSYPPKLIVERYGKRVKVAFDPKKADDLERALTEAWVNVGAAPLSPEHAKAFAGALRTSAAFRPIFF